MEPRTPSSEEHQLLRELITAALKVESPRSGSVDHEALSGSVVRDVWKKFGGHSPDERVDLFRDAMAMSPEALSALIEEIRGEKAGSFPEHSKTQKEALQQWMEAIPEQLSRVLSAPLAEMDARGGIRLPMLDSPEALEGIFSTPSPIRCVGDALGKNGHRCADLLHVDPQTEVWLARAPSPGPPDGEFALVRDPGVANALRKERDELARIQTSIGHHPHVQALKGASLEEETPFLHYEAMEGARTLEDWMHGFGGPVPPHQVIPILKQVASGLAAAHRAGIVHADVRPANIRMIPGRKSARDPTDYVVKIAGFGLGGLLVNTRVDRLSSDPTAQPKGLGHVSTERLSGRPADAADDVFSLGVLAYQMLLGNPEAEPHSDIDGDLEKLGAGHGLREMIGGAMAPPGERLADANQSLDALKSGGDLPEMGKGPWVALAALGAALGVGAYFALNPLPEAPPPPPAPVEEEKKESAEDLAERAEAHLAAHDRDAAERLWKRAAELEPENTDHVVHYARLLLERECLKSAEEVLREHLEAQPEAVDAQAMLASVLLEQGTPQAIEESGDQVAGVLLVSPEHPMATRVGGELAARDPASVVPAITLLRKAVALAPEDPEAHQALHSVLIQVGGKALKEGDMESASLHLGEAWSALQEGLEEHPVAPGLLVAKAEVLRREGKPALALALVEKALRDAPEDERLYEHVWDWVARHLPEKLLAMAQAALANRPDSALRHALLGAAQAEAGGWGDAQESLNAALALDGEHLRALQLLQEMMASAASLAQSREASGKLIPILAETGSPEALRRAQIVDLKRELSSRSPTEEALRRANELARMWRQSGEDPRRASLVEGLLERTRGNHFAEGGGGAGAQTHGSQPGATHVPPAEAAMAAAMLGAAAEAAGEPDLASLRYERCLKMNPGDPECVGRQLALHAKMGWEIPESMEGLLESLQEKCAVVARMTLDDLAEGRAPNPSLRGVVESCEDDPLSGGESRLAMAAWLESEDPGAALKRLESVAPEDQRAHDAEGIAIRAHLRLGEAEQAQALAEEWAKSPNAGSRPVLIRSVLEWMRGDPGDPALRERLANALDDAAERSAEDVVLASEITSLMARPGAHRAAGIHGLMNGGRPCTADAPCALDSPGALHAQLLTSELLGVPSPELAKKALTRHPGDPDVSRQVFHHLRRDQSTREQAREHLRSHVERWPRDRLAWARRATDLARKPSKGMAQRSQESLEATLQRMMAHSQDWVHGQVLSGWLYLLRGDRERADAALGAALVARPGHPLAQHLEGLSKSMEPVLPRDAVVSQSEGEVPTEAPSGVEAELGLREIRTLLLRGMLEEASAALERSSEESQRSPRHTYLRAVHAIATGRLEEADGLLKLLGTRPDVPPGIAANAIDARVEIHRRQGRLVVANRVLCRAARTSPHQFPAFNAVHRQVFGLPEDIRTFGERKSVACR